MNSKFFSKIVLSNIIVVGFVLSTFFMIYNVLHKDLSKILFQENQIDSFATKVNKVSENLLLSYNLQDDGFLSDAAIASNEATQKLLYLKNAGFDIQNIRQLYIEFFKYSVETTSILLENRLQEARNAHFISKEKHNKLLKELYNLNQKLTDQQNETVNRINLLMVISSTLLAIIMIGNLLYLRRSFVTMQNQQDELVELKFDAIKNEQQAAIDRATMIDALGDGVYGVDARGFCTFVNQAAIQILHYEEEEILNTHQHHLFHHHRIDNSSYPENECPIYKTLLDKKTRKTTEYFITKNGKFIPVSLTVAPIGTEGAVIVFKDITESKRYEELLEHNVQEKTKELQNLNDHLEEKIAIEVEKNQQQQAMLEQQSRLAALGDMIGNIAHQWRQPLTVISSAASGLYLKKELDDLSSDDIDELLDSITRNTQYLSNTIDTFRDYVKENKEKKEIILQDRLELVLSILKDSINNNHIKLIKKIEQEPIKLTIVAQELDEVIINIINNAKDILLERNISNKWIKVECYSNDSFITITIEDNAGGIPQNILPNIFDPYFTTKHKSQGTGLGLNISYKIITESIYGNLYTKNTEHGAKFFIEIPMES